MHLAAYMALLFALLSCLFLAGQSCYAALRGRTGGLAFTERGQVAVTILVGFASAVLFIALLARDYSFLYVYENVDNSLSLFYRLTALWAGRTGSLLFWALTLFVGGSVFAFTEGYRSMSEDTRRLFWVFFLTVESLFLLLLTCWSNPFLTAVPEPLDGLGLNPLLQNPGMAFHPPLLFLGYAFFALPACLGLAAMAASEPRSWITAVRNWTVLSWLFLTAGIILGGWWSYMELGWGGYWAWDPVENASLIPWFTGTAFLHTGLIEVRRGALQRSNVFLASATFLLCIFGTYLVRSGVDVQSLHTFGTGGVALPLEAFLVGGLLLTLLVVFLSERPVYRALHGLVSRQGFMLVAAWVLVALGLVVGLATFWPVISKFWTDMPQALDQSFYNRVCLPFLVLLALMLCVCPWLGWKGGLRHKRGLLAAAGLLVLAGVVLALKGVTLPLALVGAAAAVAVVGTVGLIFVFLPAMRKLRSSVGAHLVHLGLALVVLGVAVSGPYKVEAQQTLLPGQSMTVQNYTVTNTGLETRQTPALTAYMALVEVRKGDGLVGLVVPERRWYPNARDSYAEVSVIPGLGNEIYATLLGYDTRDGSVTLSVSVQPLVNWIWIGGTVMCLAAFLLLKRQKSVS